MAETKSVNLARLFGSVTRELEAQRDQLNQSDDYNHNHGDNMVEIFSTITEAVKTKKKAETSEQLAYAAELLGKRSNSGSAQLYQEGLVKASQQFEGQQVDSRNLSSLISTLMGAQQAAGSSQQGGSGDMLGALGGQQSSHGSPQVSGGDLLGALLEGQQHTPSKPQTKPQSKPKPSQTGSGDLLEALMGGQQSAPSKPTPKPQSPQTGSDDLLGALLGGMSGGSQPNSTQPGPDDLLGALLGGMSSGSQTGSPQSGSGDLLGALLGGMSSGSQTGSPQSGSGDLLGALLGGMSGSSSQSSQGGLDAADLLTAASTFMKAKKRGKSTVEALLNAFISTTRMSNSSHREESSMIVLNTLLKQLASAK